MLELDGAEGVREWRIHVQELDIEGVGARVGGALVRMSDGMIQGLMLELSGAKGVCEWMIHVQGLDIGGVGVRVGALIETEEDERGTAGKGESGGVGTGVPPTGSGAGTERRSWLREVSWQRRGSTTESKVRGERSSLG